MKYLSTIDLYGLKSDIRIYGKKTFTIAFGGCLTILTFGLVGVLSFLFGRDFWFKTNPKIVTKEILLEKSELIPVNSQNFTMFFRIEDQYANLVEDPDRLLSPYVLYHHYKRDDSGVWKPFVDLRINGRKCSETAAVSNTDVPNIDLTSYYCVDWEEISKIASTPESTYQPVLGGTWEEDEIGFVDIVLSSSRLETDGSFTRLDVQKVKDFVDSGLKYVAIGYPEAYFDASDLENPFKKYWKFKYTMLTNELSRVDRFSFKMNLLEDDLGWIFEAIEVVQAISVNSSSTEVNLPRGNSMFYYGFFMSLERLRTSHKRAYMKIQEVGALLGGFIKTIQVVFSVLAHRFALYNRSLFLEDKLNQFNTGNDGINSSQAQLDGNFVKSVTVDNISKKSGNRLSFFKYMFSCCLVSKQNKAKYKVAKEIQAKADNMIDVRNIFRMTLRLNNLEKKVLADSAMVKA